VAGQGGGTPLVEGDVVRHRLEATYFDTADLRLARAHLTLRRRTGGEDAGWHLKIPGGDDTRQEVRLPLGRSADTVPASLRKIVRAQMRGQALVPVGRITTDRTVHHLVDATGQVLVEVADDRVEARRLQPGDTNGSAPAVVSSWREIEVELRGGDRALLSVLDERLRSLGVEEAATRSKLARLLGPDAPSADAAGAPTATPGALRSTEPTAEPGERLTKKGKGAKKDKRAKSEKEPTPSAGEVVLHYVGTQLEQILANDTHVRIDTPGSVHQMRVATRRLRSALQTFKPVLDTATVQPLRAELKLLATELGTARDAEVLRDRLVGAVRAQRDDLPSGAALPAVDSQMADAYDKARTHLLRALDSERYHRLVDALHTLVEDPPLTADASEPAGEVLPRRARRAYATLKARVQEAHDATNPADRDHHLHEARKAAKKARYAGETLTGVFGKPARQFAAAMESLQEELGEHQDSVVMRARLLELAREDATVEAAFAYGRLHAQEEQRGAEAVERFEAAWKQASRKSLRAWL
jgi:CHAD domain-containing protein